MKAVFGFRGHVGVGFLDDVFFVSFTTGGFEEGDGFEVGFAIAERKDGEVMGGGGLDVKREVALFVRGEGEMGVGDGGADFVDGDVGSVFVGFEEGVFYGDGFEGGGVATVVIDELGDDGVDFGVSNSGDFFF